MDAESYQRAYKLFMSVVDLSPRARADFLDEACAGEPDLRAWVERLVDEELASEELAEETTLDDAIAEMITGVAEEVDGPALTRPGAIIADRFEVLEQLGVGGAAAVWKVRHRALGSLHALKVLRHAHPALVQRLMQEGKAQARIRHRNVVQVMDLVEVEGQPALIMEFVDGVDLGRYLRTSAPTEAQVDTLVRGILAGMAAVHATGMIHRDIKPANILLAQEGDSLLPKVADFGIARPQTVERSLTQTGALVGTIAYMAPEQIRDARSVDQRTDIWALGCMLYRMVTGRDAFAGPDNGAIITAILDGRVPPLPVTLPRRWRQAISAALQVDPARRPQRCADLEALWSASDTAETSVLPAAPLPVASAHPGWQSIEASRHNLPNPRSRFVGRQQEMAALSAHLLAGERLVTLLGIGGLGKTRLSVELGREMISRWPGGVWMVDLSEARTAGDIVSTTARALDIPLGAEPEQQLTHALTSLGQALLILDNFEQIVSFSAQTVGAWLDAVPGLHMLVTSREPLRLRGELTYQLGQLAEGDAMVLFEDRVRKVNPRIVLDDASRDAIRSLVHLLDRLPLAIELAAARCRMLRPAKLLSRMSRRFDLLKSKRADLPRRQQTLRAALEWSFQLMTEEEQSVLAQCSVFEGGLSLEAAEAVVAVEGDAWVEDVLQELVDKSLLMSPPDSDRLSMLLSVQEFAWEKLSDSGTVHLRHAEHFATLSPDATPLPELLAEHENLRLAARRAHAMGEHALAVQCAQAAAVVFLERGPFADGAAFVDALQAGTPAELQAPLLRLSGRLWGQAGELERAGRRLAAALQHATGPAEVGRCRGWLAEVQERQGKHEQARESYLAALQVARDAGDRHSEVLWLNKLGERAVDTGHNDEARSWLSRAAAMAAAHNERARCVILRNQGYLLEQSGDLEAAMRCYTEALPLATALGRQRMEGMLLARMGFVFFHQIKNDEAEAYFTAALRIMRRIGDRGEEAANLGRIGRIRARESKVEEALQHYEDTLRIVRELGDRQREMVWLGNTASVMMDLWRLDEAAERYQQANALAEKLNDRYNQAHWLGNLGTLNHYRGALPEALSHYEQALAITRAVENEPNEAMWMIGVGSVCLSLGSREDARRHLAGALQIIERLGLHLMHVYARDALGQLSLLEGKHDEAEQHHTIGLTVSREVGFDYGKIGVLSGLAEVAAARGDRPTALVHCAEALQLARQIQQRQMEGGLLILQGELRILQGDPGGLDDLDAGEALIREPRAPMRLADMLCRRTRLLLREGRREEAAILHEQAAELIAELRAGPASRLGVMLERNEVALEAG